MNRLFLTTIILFTYFRIQAQSGISFLGRTTGEAKVVAVRANIDLYADESEANGNVIYYTYKAQKSKGKGVDLGLNYTLMFDKTRGDTCVQVVVFPTVQQPWVIDTIIRRIEKRYNFQAYDQTTWFRSYNPGCTAHFEYVNGFAADGRKTNINLLRVTFRYFSRD